MEFSNYDEISCIKETFEFYGNRIIENRITPTAWTLTYTITPLTSNEPGELNQSVIAYEKCKFWLENVLVDVLISKLDNELGVNLCYFTENPTLLTPYGPSDNHLIQLIHSKLSVLAGEHLAISTMTLETTDSNSLCVFNTETLLYNLPDVSDMEDDLYHSEPWWKRPSFQYSDYTKDEVKADEELQHYLEADDPLDIFEREFIEMYNEVTDKKPAEAQIIKMPKKWSPKIV